ncbi:MAG: HAMP domain-containing protein, partial [Rhodospirillales bacterium]
MKLNTMSIPKRIGGGFALVLALLLAVAVIGAVGINSARQALDIYSDQAESALLLKEADSKFETLRRHISRGDHVNAVQVLNEIKVTINAAQVAITDPALDAEMKKLVALLGNYQVGLDAVGKDQSTVEDLAKVGDQISAQMDTMEDRQVAALSSLEKQAKDDAALHQAEDIALSALALALGIAASWVIARGIARPLKAMTQAMEKLAQGDLQADIPAAEGKDEITAMAQALAVFKSNGHERQRLEDAAKADMEKRLARQRRIDELTAGFDAKAAELVGAVAGAAGTLSDTATGMSAAANQTSSQATAVAA